MDLLLVTGFLGAGKTTFLGRLLALWQGRRTALIINEFGQANVDGPRLREAGAQVLEVTGGSAFCSCRLDQFEAALRSLLAQGPEAVAVEVSGLGDPSSVRRVLAGFPDINYIGCVALCGAPRIEKALATVRVCPRQLAVSDLILLNLVDLVGQKEAERLAGMLRARFSRARVETTVQAAFDPGWLAFPRREAEDIPVAPGRDQGLLGALIRLREGVPRADCEGFLRLICEDTYRIKGMLCLAEGAFLVDGVGSSVVLSPCRGEMAGLDLVLLWGEGMPLRESLRAAQAWYPGVAGEILFD
ncbi:MAG: GTP-binding protein [Christensenellales bacterium]